MQNFYAIYFNWVNDKILLDLSPWLHFGSMVACYCELLHGFSFSLLVLLTPTTLKVIGITENLWITFFWLNSSKQNLKNLKAITSKLEQVMDIKKQRDAIIKKKKSKRKVQQVMKYDAIFVFFCLHCITNAR